MHCQWLEGGFALCKLPLDAPVPALAPGAFYARTDDESSLLCREADIPTNALIVERGYAAFRVTGTLDLSLIGILATLTRALADARIPVCAVSTYDTDYLFIPVARKADAARALAEVGYPFL